MSYLDQEGNMCMLPMGHVKTGREMYVHACLEMMRTYYEKEHPSLHWIDVEMKRLQPLDVMTGSKGSSNVIYNQKKKRGSVGSMVVGSGAGYRESRCRSTAAGDDRDRLMKWCLEVEDG
jgi:hypothetical protein